MTQETAEGMMRCALIAAAVSVALAETGTKGNSPMLMQDENSDQIAEVIQKWLVAQKPVA